MEEERQAMECEQLTDVDINDPLLLKSRKRKLKNGDEPQGVAPKCSRKKNRSPNSKPGVRSELEPRSYQSEAVEKALAENTIIYLDTGSGKTHIAVMLLKRLADKLSMQEEKRVAVFLAPTVFLVQQQANVISMSTEFKVGLYYGEQMNTWDYAKWLEEICVQQVLVMTPQVFFNALQLAVLRMDMIEVLIFDECHHAQKNHVYASIMKTYYHPVVSKVKPRVVGLTGSLVTSKGATSEKISSLESVLDAKIYTLTDRTELETTAPTPFHQTKYYDKSQHEFEDLRASLEILLHKYLEEQNMVASNFSDEKDTKKRMRKLLYSLYKSIETCLCELGLWSASLAVEVSLKDKFCGDSGTTEEELSYKDRFLKDVSELFKTSIPQGLSNAMSSPDDVKAALNDGFITPKIEALLALLMRYRTVDGFRCIVFVERVTVSVVLASLLRKFTCLEFVRSDYMIGVNADTNVGNSNRHQETLQSFQDGKVNVLVSTSVAEEGLDVKLCHCAVRFDLCRTVRSFIQSRGRARKAGADYVWLLERGNLDHENLFLDMIKSEKMMREEALLRMIKPVEIKPLKDEEVEMFHTNFGLCISTSGSVSFIHQYCAQLPGDRYYNPTPEFVLTKCDTGEFKCNIRFPPNAHISSFEGPMRRTKDLAKRVACLDACRKLDALGVLKRGNGSADGEDDEEKMFSRDMAGSGSTKLKELFPSASSTTFKGDWLTSSVGANMYLYALIFEAEQLDDRGYMNFVFLIDRALDEDVGNLVVNLYSTKARKIKAKLSFMGQCWLDSSQLAAAKMFQEIIFNGAFSRLVFRENEKDRTLAKCLLTYDKYSKDIWSQMYLLLPMSDQGESIDWNAISATAAAAKLFSNFSTVLRRDTPENRADISLERPESNVVYTAAGPVDVEAILDTVVLTVHTGKLFCVSEVVYEIDARSVFQENADAEPCTYEAFFIRKHGRLLQYQAQPLFRVKPTHAVHNHLLHPNLTKKRGGPKREIVENLVELPPELCLVLGLRSSLIRSLYLVPSFMYRFTAYVISAELRAKFTKDVPCAHASKILEALTSTRCQEGFSYEGLELLGDSVLKYAASRKLFLMHADKHEGQLSALRSQAISNATLRRVAVAKGLPSYIRDEPFYPTLWLGAGMYRLKKRKCLCRLSQLITETSSEPKPTSYSFYIGKTCGEGHRWMCSKTTSDVVEALIGAYAVGGGFRGALEFMKALDMDVDIDHCLIASTQQCVDVPPEAVELYSAKLSSLEKIISYSFKNKALLLQAITHPTVPDTMFCYQRLEFLGDAALDLLVSQHMFISHPGLTPGLLSDLRSAAVNNDCFARVAVKHKLDTYLRHDSGVLDAEIKSYLDVLSQQTLTEDPSYGFNTLCAPKVLGDLVESIAGAVLVDTGFDLEKLWSIMKPLLSPLVTPVTLPFHPIRECQELCSLNYLDWNWKLSNEETTAEFCVQINDATYTASSERKKKRDAKKEAAEKMLTILKGLGLRHPRWDSVPVECTEKGLSFTNAENNSAAENGIVEPMLETQENPAQECSTLQASSPVAGTCLVQPNGQAKLEEKCTAVNGVSSTVTGASLLQPDGQAKPPRMILHELCTERRWQQPAFQENEKLGSSQRQWFSFTICMEIPGLGSLQQVSCLMGNKKRAKDDAAQKMVAHLKSLAILS